MVSDERPLISGQTLRLYHHVDRYGSILLESGIFLSHILWLLRTRKIRKEAKSRGKTFDDIAAEHEEHGISFKFAERKSRKQIKEQNDTELGTARREATSNTDQTQENVDHNTEGAHHGSSRIEAGATGRSENVAHPIDR